LPEQKSFAGSRIYNCEGTLQRYQDRAIGVLGLFLIGIVGVAAHHLPRENSGPVDRAIGYGARAALAAVGVVGWLVDRFSERRDDTSPSPGLRWSSAVRAKQHPDVS